MAVIILAYSKKEGFEFMIKRNRIILSALLSCSILATGCGAAASDNSSANVKSSSENVSSSETSQSPDIFSNVSSVLSYDKNDSDYTVPSDYTAMRDGSHYGKAQTITYYSDTVNKERNASVILPYDYNSSKTYPVLYLLHGMGGSCMSYNDGGGQYVIQNAIDDYSRNEVIIVAPSVFTTKSDNSEDAYSFPALTAEYDNCCDDIINNLMPYINEHFSVKTGREYTAVAGYSLGGRESLYLCYSHPEIFGYVAAFSPVQSVFTGPDNNGLVLPTLINGLSQDIISNPPYLTLLNVGVEDPYCLEATYYYDKYFNENGIEHIFYDMPGGHDADVWFSGLYNFCRRIF